LQLDDATFLDTKKRPFSTLGARRDFETIRRTSKKQFEISKFGFQVFPPKTKRISSCSSCLFLKQLLFRIYSKQPQDISTLINLTADQRRRDVLVTLLDSSSSDNDISSSSPRMMIHILQLPFYNTNNNEKKKTKNHHDHVFDSGNFQIHYFGNVTTLCSSASASSSSGRVPLHCVLTHENAIRSTVIHKLCAAELSSSYTKSTDDSSLEFRIESSRSSFLTVSSAVRRTHDDSTPPPPPMDLLFLFRKSKRKLNSDSLEEFVCSKLIHEFSSCREENVTTEEPRVYSLVDKFSFGVGECFDPCWCDKDNIKLLKYKSSVCALQIDGNNSNDREVLTIAVASLKKNEAKAITQMIRSAVNFRLSSSYQNLIGTEALSGLAKYKGYLAEDAVRKQLKRLKSAVKKLTESDLDDKYELALQIYEKLRAMKV